MRRLLVAILVLVGACVVGCNPDGPQRNEVRGKVTFKKQPLDEGIIDFIPLDNQGTQDAAQILNGEYRISSDKGLQPGRYRIAITAGDGLSGAGQAEPTDPKPGVTPGKERIPPEFNVKSEQICEVKKGVNVFDFNIP